MAVPSSPLRVAYPGAAGSYSEEAAGILFPEGELVSLRAWDQVADAAFAGDVERAVLPIENSLAGIVPDTMTVLESGRLAIVAEAVLHIPHCLAGVPGATVEGIRAVHSHPMALAQCRTALEPIERRIGAPTTADAARTVAELGDPAVAAISSPLAAVRHGLVILRDDVSDHPENFTRFVALAPFTRLDRVAHGGEWHTALRFVTSHEPGALHEAIEPFRYHRIQMTSLHSRPIMGQAWRYQFNVDIDGHRSDERVRRALADMAERTAFLETLGTYPVTRDPYTLDLGGLVQRRNGR